MAVFLKPPNIVHVEMLMMNFVLIRVNIVATLSASQKMSVVQNPQQVVAQTKYPVQLAAYLNARAVQKNHSFATKNVSQKMNIVIFVQMESHAKKKENSVHH